MRRLRHKIVGLVATIGLAFAFAFSCSGGDLQRAGSKAKHSDDSKDEVIGDGTGSSMASGSGSGTSSESGSGAIAGAGSGHAAFSTVVKRVTDKNRVVPGAMFGGWGPHLRGVMRDAAGALWMAVDAPSSTVNLNVGMNYFRRAADEMGWALVQHFDFNVSGLQQNLASVMSDKGIYSYGINVPDKHLEECFFSFSSKSAICNSVVIGGTTAYQVPASSNYVGATIASNGTRVVWWTVVGDHGAAGSLLYTYNSGGGWNGPVSIALGGFNDFSYIYAAFKSPNELMLAGQLLVGDYANGPTSVSYRIGVATFKLGSTATLSTPLANFPDGNPANSTDDIWINPDNGDVHLLAYSLQGKGREVAYFVQRGGKGGFGQPVISFPSAYRARFLQDADRGVFLIVGAEADGQSNPIDVRYLDRATLAKADFDWSAAPQIAVDLTASGLAAPWAIYVESTAYQTTPLAAATFAICGGKGHDQEIWQVELKGVDTP